MDTQREIKFRGFYKEAKYFIYSDNYDFIDLDDNCFCDIIEGTPIRTYTEDLQQFTGLKDKNGKEIYEGDIITNYGVTKEMKTRRYEVVFTEDRARFSAYDLSSKWNTSMSSYDMKQCEVIGNKYENPELIN